MLSLRTFALIVSARPYCARKFTCHVMHESALSNKMIGQMATLNSFAWFYRSWTFGDPYFSFDGLFSLPIFYVLWKNEKIYWLEVWIFCKMHHRIPLFLAIHLSVRRFQMPLEGFSFVKTLAKFGIIYSTDLLLQNMTKIGCLPWLTFDMFNFKAL